MSRKVENFGGKHFELYKEWPEEDCVFLALEGFNFEASKNKVTVQIPAPLWDVLRTYPGCVTELAALDEKTLLARAKQTVDERIAEWQKLSPKDRTEFWNFHLRDAGKPRIVQMRLELEILLADRDSQAAMLRKIAAYKKETTHEAAAKQTEVNRRHWKRLEARAEKQKADEGRRCKEQQTRHNKIIDRLLAQL